MNESLQQFQTLLEKYWEVEPVFLFAKGRLGLYAVLKACGIGAGAEVLVPGYTCIVVPNAVLAAGAKPLYADIDPKTYNMTLDSVLAACTPNTRALVIQHTYGIPCDAGPILHWAHENGVLIIEDCCHAFGSRYKGQPCGSFGAAAFYSGQWNKPFSTGLGGMLRVNDKSVAASVRRLAESELQHPSGFYNARMSLQIALYSLLVNPCTTPLLTSLYRLTSWMGLSVGSSDTCELQGNLPPNYFLGLSPAQARKGIREMNALEANLAHRKQLSSFYRDELPRYGFAPVAPDPESEPVFLRYPVRVANKQEVLSAALKKGAEIGSWFESPLHPVETLPAQYGYTSGCCPEAEKAARETVNLPTHRKITKAEAERLLMFMQTYARPGQ